MKVWPYLTLDKWSEVQDNMVFRIPICQYVVSTTYWHIGVKEQRWVYGLHEKLPNLQMIVPYKCGTLWPCDPTLHSYNTSKNVISLVDVKKKKGNIVFLFYCFPSMLFNHCKKIIAAKSFKFLKRYINRQRMRKQVCKSVKHLSTCISC